FFCMSPTPSALYTVALRVALPICHARAVDGHRDVLRHRAGCVLAAAQGMVDVRAGRAADRSAVSGRRRAAFRRSGRTPVLDAQEDRKSTRLNSSHVKISYAVF